MLFLSPRNSLEGQLHILESARCNIFACPKERPPGVNSIFTARPMREVDVPELQDWLEGPKAPHRSYDKTLDEVRHEPLMLLHSSGSTGLPKPIGYTHGTIAASKAQMSYPGTGLDRTLLQCVASGPRLFAGFPLFHAGGLYFPLVYAVFAGVVIVLPPVGQPLSAEMADEMHRYAHIQTSCLPPSILEDISAKPSFLERMKGIQYVITGGAPLPKSVGDSIQHEGTRIYNMLASTETGILPQLDIERDDWQYIRFAPLAGADLRPHSDGLHELVIVRDEKLQGCQGVFENFPGLQEYSTQDLFRRHPDTQKADLWAFCGRHDDIVVMLNGEKFSPSSMEQVIQAHPLVRTALVYGEARVQAALLVELVLDWQTESREALIDQMWPTIEQGNHDCPAHGRLSKSLILFTDFSKPMVRTPKGSVIRRSTFDLYSMEINTLYDTQESHSSMINLKLLDVHKITTSMLRLFIKEVTCLDIDYLADDENLFTVGMDSLQVLHLTHNLNASLGKHVVEPGMIYTNPTITKMAKALQSTAASITPLVDDRASRIDKMLKKYLRIQPFRIALLTGSTGGLGSYLLKAFVEDGSFSKIYCLVRTMPATSSSYGDRVVYLKCDLSDPELGLSQEIYADLVKEVTHILHNAWRVDFNLSLESFETQVRGVCHLIDLAKYSNHKAHIFFISSVAAVLNAKTTSVEEVIYDDSSIAQPSGYGESKHIAERLLYQAGLESNVTSTIARVGQIAGPVHDVGVWNRREWLPSMIASSQYLGCIPNSLGTVDMIEWIPIDILSKIIAELLLNQERFVNHYEASAAARTQVFHLVNPSPTNWPALLPKIQKHISKNESEIEVVSFADWTQRLQASAGSGLQDLASNPAIKLLDFFRDISHSDGHVRATLETRAAVQRSPTLAGLGPVSPEWMARWMDQWGYEVEDVGKDEGCGT